MKMDIKVVKIKTQYQKLITERLNELEIQIKNDIEIKFESEEYIMDAKYLSEILTNAYFNTNYNIQELQEAIEYYEPFYQLYQYYESVHDETADIYIHYIIHTISTVITDELQDFCNQLYNDLYKQTKLNLKQCQIQYELFVKATNNEITKLKDNLMHWLADQRWKLYIKYYRDTEFYYGLFQDVLKGMNGNTTSKQKLVKMTKTDAIIDKLTSEGYSKIRQTGSHAIYSNGTKSIPVPIHGKDIKKGLCYGIQKEI